MGAYGAVALSLLAATGAAEGPLVAAAGRSVWPQPRSLTTGSAPVQVVASPEFFKTNARGNSFLDQAFARYMAIIFPHETWLDAPPAQQGLKSMMVKVDTPREDYPQLNTDEGYTLFVPTNKDQVTVRAKTVFGALRALETFSQLVTYNFSSSAYELQGAPIRIDDKPRFPHRGLMVNTGRQYIPVPFLRHILDSMQYAKLNVLHWHMSDDLSFPFQSKRWPLLWEGARSPSQRYTQRDVAGVVQFARSRGVRVMVEFDVPGHARSWCAGYPGICPNSTCQTPLNVANETTFEVIGDLLKEVTGEHRSTSAKAFGLFPDDLLHLGGDGVDTTCWSQTPEVAGWMKERGMTAADAYQYFVTLVAKMAKEQGRRPVHWSEVFERTGGALTKGAVVHFRRWDANVTEVLKAGHSVLRDVSWGAQQGKPGQADVTWETVYSADPCQGIATEEQCEDFVLGGHGELAETGDGSTAQLTAWPRLAAVAEKLWSLRKQTADAPAALPRVRAFRCLLVERGVPVAELDGEAGSDTCLRPSAVAAGRSVAAFYP